VSDIFVKVRRALSLCVHAFIVSVLDGRRFALLDGAVVMPRLCACTVACEVIAMCAASHVCCELQAVRVVCMLVARTCAY
jgi:hypothetical protein